jgi:hypothetical protein
MDRVYRASGACSMLMCAIVTYAMINVRITRFGFPTLAARSDADLGMAALTHYPLTREPNPTRTR